MKKLRNVLIITASCLMLFSCNKKNNVAYEKCYKGTLYVNYTNTMPEWSVNETMKVEINYGMISVNSSTLNYSGETLVSDDSKIVRSGQWHMLPEGLLTTEGGIDYVTINAQITVIDDIQQVYAKDNLGNWILVSEVNYTGTPNSDLSFVFNDAETGGGSTCGITAETGSVIWTLFLTVTID